MRDYQTHAVAPKTIVGVAALAIPAGFKSAEVTAMGGVAVTFTGMALQYDTQAGPYAGTLPVGATISGVTAMNVTAGQIYAVFFRT